MKSNTLRINFYPCYERFCRLCADGSYTDKEKWKTCEFNADNVAERARKRVYEKKTAEMKKGWNM